MREKRTESVRKMCVIDDKAHHLWINLFCVNGLRSCRLKKTKTLMFHNGKQTVDEI